MATIALSRPVSESLGRCELTHLERVTVDVARAQAQHELYEAALRGLGCAVVPLPAAHDLPDAVFVEDTAVVVDEVGVLTRPGAESRRPEIGSMAAVLSRYRVLRTIDAPGTLDGGDVLQLGRRVFVGLSRRSNAQGVEQLAAALGPFGYTVRGLPVTGALHLKTAATRVAPDVVLLNPRWVDAGAFTGMRLVEVDPEEPWAGNALEVNGTVLFPAAFPRTRERLEALGLTVRTLDASELAKAEGGLTCGSVIFRVP
jgi:dimethylargininase